jgi:hypothetical protein
VRNFVTSRKTRSFSRRGLFHGFSIGSGPHKTSTYKSCTKVTEVFVFVLVIKTPFVQIGSMAKHWQLVTMAVIGCVASRNMETRESSGIWRTVADNQAVTQFVPLVAVSQHFVWLQCQLHRLRHFLYLSHLYDRLFGP